MKKFYLLMCALLGLTGTVKASSADDIAPCKHSYVLVCDDYNNKGTEKIPSGTLFGDDHFLSASPGGLDKSNGKKSIDLSDAATWGEETAAKYGEYGTHLCSMRIKNAQDVFALKVTAGSKIRVFFNGQGKTGSSARKPKFATDVNMNNALNSAPADNQAAINLAEESYTATDDQLIYIGSYNGDTYVAYVIVEANEAPGTPLVKVGPQSYDEGTGLYFKEVTATPVTVTSDGITQETVLTYTTDGTDPLTSTTAKEYENSVMCYADQTVKFQAYFIDLVSLMGYCDESACPDANNDANVNFMFNAPKITSDGGNITITSEYVGAKNYYKLNDGEETEGSSATLTESATVTAFSKIVNGEYATFTTNSASTDVYVLNPIKEKKTITVSGNAVVDEEATANSTTGTVYKIENGAITADKADFFVKNLELVALANADANVAKYQVPAGQEAYIKMNQTNITFKVAEGDSVDVTIICSKNACKNLNPDDDPSITTDRQCFVNINGTNYGNADVTAEDGNIIKLGLGAGTYTIAKYSGTGNIMISSIEINPADPTGINIVTATEENANAPIYNLAGQKVSGSYKGIVIQNGKKFMNK